MFSEPDAARVVVDLARALRREGLRVGVDRTQACAIGAALSGDLYWAGRLTLLSRVDDIAVYDRVFYALLGKSAVESASASQDLATGVPGNEEIAGSSVTRGVDRKASRIELLRHTPFTRLTDDEVAELARAMSAVRRRAPVRRSRRRRPAPNPGRFDVRSTIRQMQRLDGDLAPLRFTAAKDQVQALTFVIDVSGSMSTASRGLLLAVASFVRAARAHEAFGFGTRLTRLTTVLRASGIEQSIDAAAQALRDREAGTRIGESLRELIDGYGQTRAVRGAAIVIYSDGLERGDPALLEREMMRLSLQARRVLWLNPLSASPDWQPVTRGMTAALPYTDELRSGHNLASFEEAVDGVLRRLGSG